MDWNTGIPLGMEDQILRTEIHQVMSPSIPSEKPKQPESREEWLKKQILALKDDNSLTTEERARKMQELMTRKWSMTQAPTNVSQPENSDSCSYWNKQDQILGCSHYRRNCKLKAACCNKLYVCRFCHDEAEDHAIDRYATKEMVCMACKTNQPIGKVCANRECGKVMGQYYCDICKFHDDDPDKDVYHCPHCGICRIGKGLGIDYFHCHTCNACMSLSHVGHKCIERLLESDCPICHQYMFTSTTPVMFMPCGHAMHVSCFEQYTTTHYTCPLCSKSLWDMKEYFAGLEELLKFHPLPQQLQGKISRIFCCDCEKKSEVPFHYCYHRCEGCGSYNTKVLDTRLQDVEAGQSEAPSQPPMSFPTSSAPANSGDVEMTQL